MSDADLLGIDTSRWFAPAAAPPLGPLIALLLAISTGLTAGLSAIGMAATQGRERRE